MKLNKNGFAMITTLLLVVMFSYLSINIIQTNNIGQNLNILKYLHLQAKIHLDSLLALSKEDLQKIANGDDIKKYIDDSRYNMSVSTDQNRTKYCIVVETADQSHIRLSQIVIK